MFNIPNRFIKTKDKILEFISVKLFKMFSSAFNGLIAIALYRRAWPKISWQLNSERLSIFRKKSSFIYLKTKIERTDILFQLSTPILIVGMSVRICLFFFPVTLLGIIAMATGRNTLLFNKALRLTLQMAGPTFSKLGQWASTRPDILPLSLCTELGKLQSSVPPHHMSWNRRVIEEVFGLPMDHIFEYFNQHPAGSGTIGQVHQARLKVNPNEVVAVKIIHPGIHDRIKHELLLIDFIAKLLDNVPGLGWMGFREQARLFKQMMLGQLDLRQEAWTLSRFSRNLRTNNGVQFARPILSTPDLLIETWQEGVPLETYLRDYPNATVETAKLAEAGLSAFLKMLLWDNFIHADLHPGNLKVSHSKPPKLIFLDTGLTIELSGRDHDNLADLFRYLFLEHNSQRVAELLLERKPQPQVQEPQEFIKEFATLCDRILPSPSQLKSMRLSSLPVGETLIMAFELARKHRVQLEPAFTRVIMSLVVIEGVGRQLAPDLQLLPIIRQAAVQYLISETARRLTQKIQPIL